MFSSFTYNPNQKSFGQVQQTLQTRGPKIYFIQNKQLMYICKPGNKFSMTLHIYGWMGHPLTTFSCWTNGSIFFVIVAQCSPHDGLGGCYGRSQPINQYWINGMFRSRGRRLPGGVVVVDVVVDDVVVVVVFLALVTKLFANNFSRRHFDSCLDIILLITQTATTSIRSCIVTSRY